MTQSDDIPPWPDLIAEMGLLRMRVEERNELHPATIPHLAATTERLDMAESRLGHSLDAQHREFLSYGNGWPEFHIDDTLMNTEDFGQGALWTELNRRLDAFYSVLPKPSPIPPREQVYPITHAKYAPDIFVIWRGGPVTAGGHPVLWLPWQEDLEPYDHFFEFFQATYQLYERLEG